MTGWVPRLPMTGRARSTGGVALVWDYHQRREHRASAQRRVAGGRGAAAGNGGRRRVPLTDATDATIPYIFQLVTVFLRLS